MPDVKRTVWLTVASEFTGEVNGETVGPAFFPWFEWEYPVPGPSPSLPLQLAVVSDDDGVSVELRDPFGTPVGMPMGWLWREVDGEDVDQRRAERRAQ